MLKFIFWALLLINGALFAYHQGHLDSLLPVSREPARLAQQINADKIRLLPADARPANQAPASPAANPAIDPASKAEPVAAAATLVAAADAALPVVEVKPDADKKAEAEKKADADKKVEANKKADRLVCTEIGNFSEADAGRFEARLAALTPGARLSRRVIREVSSHMVYIPPQGSKENADRKVDQLRGLGVTDFYMIQDQSEMRWGISLGIFSTEEAAKKRLEQLKQQGVRSGRIGARNAVNKVAFQLRALDAAGREKVEKIKTDFPQQQQHNCAA
ncbi:SPOR domain-containing protein [Noviherbaspirillum sedimenti]|uniref:SPOR domain-containing protein n=1 Tax=Noviherbaspirillum sedimenti TaxID=2320865 RepID=A0A3A3G8Q8_9BURK|nr:SPOR domain-containing protein [Noviherbaspirillum sedimenti]RJG03139.1 SPOR domain-containing protein [Noviherbaspirillum sedimenti]